MLSLDDYLRKAEIAHSHLCAGQVLGVRMAMLGPKTRTARTASAW
jgi:formylmethanofuran dehydrogenase subunit E